MVGRILLRHILDHPHAPLQEIGGFPTDLVTEDYLLTLRLKEAGYSTAYFNEPLTYGFAPEGLKEYTTQRSRWCLGFMQIVRGRSGPFSHERLGCLDRLSLVELSSTGRRSSPSRAGPGHPDPLPASNINPFRRRFGTSSVSALLRLAHAHDALDHQRARRADHLRC